MYFLLVGDVHRGWSTLSLSLFSPTNIESDGPFPFYRSFLTALCSWEGGIPLRVISLGHLSRIPLEAPPEVRRAQARMKEQVMAATQVMTRASIWTPSLAWFSIANKRSPTIPGVPPIETPAGRVPFGTQSGAGSLKPSKLIQRGNPTFRRTGLDASKKAQQHSP